MKTMHEIHLDETSEKVMREITDGICGVYDVDSIVLFGSVARGAADDESDIDLLILTKRALTRDERHVITHIVFEKNLEHGTNFSTTVVDANTWQNGMYSVLPIHDEISRDGVVVWNNGQR